MSNKYLRRYTDLPALIYLLSKQKITLLDPQSWDDGNDSHYLALYLEKMHLRSVLALCFTQTDEQYHHWRVFAGGPSGVCVRFNRSALLKATEPLGLRTRSVKYLTLGEIGKKSPRIDDLPFLKRYAFQDEAEFRMIYASKTSLSKLDIPIPLTCVSRITLSPWIHRDLFVQVEQRLRSIKACSGLDIVRSTLIGNAEWKRRGEAAR